MGSAVVLFHGTGVDRLDSILRSGLREQAPGEGVFFAEDLVLARWYAVLAARFDDEAAGVGVILEVDVDARWLDDPVVDRHLPPTLGEGLSSELVPFTRRRAHVPGVPPARLRVRMFVRADAVELLEVAP